MLKDVILLICGIWLFSILGTLYFGMEMEKHEFIRSKGLNFCYGWFIHLFFLTILGIMLGPLVFISYFNQWVKARHETKAQLEYKKARQIEQLEAAYEKEILMKKRQHFIDRVTSRGGIVISGRAILVDHYVTVPEMVLKGYIPQDEVLSHPLYMSMKPLRLFHRRDPDTDVMHRYCAFSVDSIQPTWKILPYIHIETGPEGLGSYSWRTGTFEDGSGQFEIVGGQVELGKIYLFEVIAEATGTKELKGRSRDIAYWRQLRSAELTGIQELRYPEASDEIVDLYYFKVRIFNLIIEKGWSHLPHTDGTYNYTDYEIFIPLFPKPD